jgi:putative heme-binding domain-containing protein
MADDLSSYARGRSVASIRSSIANPPEPSGDKDHPVTLETTDGTRFTGLIRAQDNFTIVFQDDDGSYHSIPRAAIRNLSVSEHASMPRNYGTALTQTQLNDVVSYLLKSAASAHTPTVISAEDRR